jgi:catechol 2,3-dioxygenase-like lactoylglutathione lyase family enzyme
MNDVSDEPCQWMTGLDHPVIAVRDMTAARAAYERLGFTIPPRGSHIEWGTGNWCIMFRRDYLELRGIVKEGQAHNLGEFLATRGEGLMGVALGTNDAQASYEAMLQRRFHPQAVKSLTRNFELPEGWVQPRFSLCFLDESETAGLMSVVFCQHLTPELLRRPGWLEHENGAIGVLGVTGVVEDLDAAAATYRRWFGESCVNRYEDRLIVRLGDRRFKLITPDQAGRLFPVIEPNALGALPRLLAVSLACRDIDAAEVLFQQRGVRSRREENILQVAPSEACGVTLEFRGVPRG